MSLGQYCYIHPSVELREFVSIGDNAYIRSGCIFYDYVVTGDNFQTGHNVLIREHTDIGHYVRIGSFTVIEGNCKIGDLVNIQSQVNITWGTRIEDNVFIGPGTMTLNDKYPVSNSKDDLKAPVFKNGCVIGGGVTVLPGVTIGEQCLIGAGSVVVNSIAPNWVAYGNPCRAIRKNR